MKNIIMFLFLALALSSCNEGCHNAQYTFTQNYEEVISISKSEINNHIGKPLTFYVTKQHLIYEKLQDNYADYKWSGDYRVATAEPYYFYVRMNEPSNANFNFLKSVQVNQGNVNESPIPFAYLFFIPKDENSLQLTVTGSQWENELANRMVKNPSDDNTFTISVTFEPEKEIDSNLTIKLDFTIKWHVFVNGLSD